MNKIILSCGEESKTAFCKGLSQHVWNRYNVHGLSASGKAWIDGHDPKLVYVTSLKNDNTLKLDEVTDDPLP